MTCTIFISVQCGTSIVQLFTILSKSPSLSQISSKPVFSVILPILPHYVIIIGITRLCAIWRRDTNVGLTFGDSWYAELRHNPQITEQVHRIWQAYSDDPPYTFNSWSTIFNNVCCERIFCWHGCKLWFEKRCNPATEWEPNMKTMSDYETAQKLYGAIRDCVFVGFRWLNLAELIGALSLSSLYGRWWWSEICPSPLRP